MLKILKINQFRLLFLVCFTLPMYTRLNNILLGLFIIFSFVIAFRGGYKLQLSSLKQFFPVLVFFLLALIASITDSASEFIKQLERYFAFLLIPITFSLLRIEKEKLIKHSFWGLTIGCIATLMICYFNTFYEIIVFEEPLSYFLRWRHLSHRFTEVAGTHPAYLGLFICASSFFLLVAENKLNRKFKILILIFFFFGLLQLAARVAIIIYFILFLIYFISHVKNNYKYAVAIVILILITSIFYFSKGSSYYKERFFSYNTIVEDSRFKRLEASFTVFLNEPFFGAGFNSIDEKRVSEYRKFDDDVAVKKAYNAHNQFLEFLSINGIIGGLSYLCVFIFLIIKSYKQKNYLFLLVISSFFVANFTESMMVRIKGIEYFSIFVSLYLMQNSKNDNK